MNAPSDPQLLREFASHRSETAFAELVRRHIDFVHSTASRLTNDPHLAKDVAQGVFVALAKEAGNLVKHPVLAGWLHRTTRNIAAQSIRTEVRRRHREQEAATMHAHPDAGPAWDEVSPVLDAALAELSESDRDAVLLRYFENKPAHEMAAILGIGTEAAQKRVSRAVERLRENFARRGITAGTAGLASVISTHAVQVAPAGLAASVSSVAVMAAPTVAKAFIVSLLRKAALGTAASAAVFTAVYQTQRASDLRERNEIVKLELAALPDKQTTQAPPSAPTRAVGTGDTGQAGLGPDSESDESSDFMIVASIGGPTDPKDFSLFAPAGRGITTGAAEIVNLSPVQRKAVDKIIRTHWKRMEEEFGSRAVEVTAGAPETKEFSVPARSDGGSGPRRQLEADLDAEVGIAKRKILMGNLKPHEFFAGFGAMDVHFVFGKHHYKSSITDPVSGKSEHSISGQYESFIDQFGTSFELPESWTNP